MDASIVISTYGRGQDVVDCINSLLNLNKHNFEIIVIESSPNVLTALDLKKRYKDNLLVRITHSKIPIGLSRARNLGVLLAKNDIVVFIDDDCIACPNWLQNLLNVFNTKKTGIVGGRSIPLFLTERVPRWLDDRLTPAIGISHFSNKRQKVEYVLGCNFAVRKELFNEMNLFREDLGRRGKLLLSNEEVEFCKRVKEAGYLVIYTPKAVVRHKVYPTRLDRSYFFKRFFYGGLSEGIMHTFGIRKLFFVAKELLKNIIYFFRNANMFSLCLIFEKLGLFVSILYIPKSGESYSV
ncbi:glycosyltransferase family 2 protein [Candidatus Borrarchaeum sp.]|uniref:glycosyltransferase family 2 protein n=1 Tax=Candidatus Borrarchaeum sp. TaxID=2846742 RepID=UPI0025810C87|nr:glycosyltransferase family 2 protein [Candidatus Borrarchaeum sp.]